MATPKEFDINFELVEKYFITYVAPCLMLISTAFTLQCIGHSMLDSRRFFRMLGGTIAMFGMIFPIFFLNRQRKPATIALGGSLILSIFVANGFLCGC